MDINEPSSVNISPAINSCPQRRISTKHLSNAGALSPVHSWWPSLSSISSDLPVKYNPLVVFWSQIIYSLGLLPRVFYLMSQEICLQSINSCLFSVTCFGHLDQAPTKLHFKILIWLLSVDPDSSNFSFTHVKLSISPVRSCWDLSLDKGFRTKRVGGWNCWRGYVEGKKKSL